MAEIWGAAIIGGAVLAGGVVGAIGSTTAAGIQAGAAESAQQISLDEFNTITNQNAAYLNSGYGAQGQLNYLLGIGTPGGSPNNPIPTALGIPGGSNAGVGSEGQNLGYGSLFNQFNTSDWQQLSPAYGFQVQQGAQGVLNNAADTQGGESGAAQSALLSSNQQIANTSFGNAFQMYNQQQNQIYSRLAGLIGTGQAAANNMATSGTALAGQAAQSAQNAGNAIAGGVVGATNSLSNAASQYGALQYGGATGGTAGGQNMVTYYDAAGNPYSATQASGGFAASGGG